MRMYQEIWFRLKKNKVVQVTANKALHPRIIKAVTKEKWMDREYKIEIEPRESFMDHTIKGSIITFTLELRLLHVTERDI